MDPAMLRDGEMIEEEELHELTYSSEMLTIESDVNIR